MNTAKKTVAPLSKRWVTWEEVKKHKLTNTNRLYALLVSYKAECFVPVLWCRYLGVDAAVWQSQVGAVLVTDRAHDDVSGLADFFTGQQHLEKCVNSNSNELFHQLWEDLNKCCCEASIYNDFGQMRGSTRGICRFVYLTWQCSTVKTPYRNTKRPTRAAGNSIPVYQPSQAKYRPIFSPKYLLKQQQHPQDQVLKSSDHCYYFVSWGLDFKWDINLMRSSGWYLYQTPHQAQHSYSRCRWFSAPCVRMEFLLWYLPC